MSSFALTNPTAVVSRGVENLVIYSDDSNILISGTANLLSRLVSMVVFPIFLILELVFKRIPIMLLAIGTDKFQTRADNVIKFLAAIIPAIVLGGYAPEAMPGFFLKRQKTPHEVIPFGVEKIFGKAINAKIDYPEKVEDVQALVWEAIENKQQIAVIGAGMSQGTQTVPQGKSQRVINTKRLNHIQVNAQDNTVTVGAGATWEQIQLELDKVGKSAIVKQASDIFSIGGSIGINCHGWAHEYGALSKTVRSLKVVDAHGALRTLYPPRVGVPMEELTDDEKLFKCMFGTMGYFGIVVEATLNIVDNEELIEDTVEVDRDQFISVYEDTVRNQDVSLFGGRLILDSLHGDPMRSVCMVSYRRPSHQRPLANRRIVKEPEWGTRFQRIGLKLFAHLSKFSVKRLTSYFWKQERAAMFEGRIMTRNEALHPPINAFKMLHNSDVHAQWLQEYFIDKDRLPNFLRFLGAELKANDVRLINATIRPTPKDSISILPYAEKDRYAVVICFAQRKSKAEIARTKKWIENVNAYLASEKGVFYQAYMPFATVEQFETCYGKETVEEMRRLKQVFDPLHVFGNAHTAKYYDRQEDL